MTELLQSNVRLYEY